MKKIEIRGVNGTMLCDWPAAALLRDNVMHWLENELPSGRFPTIHALAEWPSPSRPAVRAEDLADELAIALPLLRATLGKDVAVGIWTRARMTGQRVPPDARGTMLARVIGWAPPVALPDDISLEAAYAPLLRAVQRVAGRATTT